MVGGPGFEPGGLTVPKSENSRPEMAETIDFTSNPCHRSLRPWSFEVILPPDYYTKYYMAAHGPRLAVSGLFVSKLALTSDAFNRGEPSLRPFRLDGDDELRRLDRPD